MKAIILAAGLGTRLLPLTEKRPKPLFPILGRPLIDIIIRRLEDTSCKSVIINTHHLAHVIEEFVKSQSYSISVAIRNEPTILGTGGAIKNVEDFWDDRPFLVVNGDIFTNIDIDEVYRFHLSHKHSVTLVIHDYSKFNHVWVDSSHNVCGFGHTAPCPPAVPDPTQGAADSNADATPYRQLAFTGIHVLDPQVLSYIPKEGFYNIIDAYCEMIKQGLTIKAFIAGNHYWHDIGTITGYRAATREAMAREGFKAIDSEAESESLIWSQLKGDGSDRTWYRVSVDATGQPTIIMVDHGLPPEEGTCEADSFAAIGMHLHKQRIPVPRIFAYDRNSGLIALEDLGNLHLQHVIRNAANNEEVLSHYRAVIDRLILMGLEGEKGFDPSFTYQTPYYDQGLILERECRYFVEAFLNGYKGQEIKYDDLKEEFEILAKSALGSRYNGFLHRDFQSRNILFQNQHYYFIDFQGGRLGPLQYDLASLLIDPYVELPRALQLKLLNYYLKRLSDFMTVDADEFLDAYMYCAMSRNLQMLGAFGFLTCVKGKKDFEAYISPAVSSLKARLHTIDHGQFPKLSSIIKGI